jgi:hypothetical protein
MGRNVNGHDDGHDDGHFARHPDWQARAAGYRVIADALPPGDWAAWDSTHAATHATTSRRRQPSHSPRRHAGS